MASAAPPLTRSLWAPLPGCPSLHHLVTTTVPFQLLSLTGNRVGLFIPDPVLLWDLHSCCVPPCIKSTDENCSLSLFSSKAERHGWLGATVLQPAQVTRLTVGRPPRRRSGGALETYRGQLGRSAFLAWCSPLTVPQSLKPMLCA